MIKTIAIPARLQKQNLTADEQAELAQYGDHPMTAEEIIARQADEAAAAATQPRLDLLAQIASIESSITSRRIREAVIGIDAGWLAAREAEISTLRAQL